MATVLPPPSKRQKLEASEKIQRAEEIARIPDDIGSVRIQFLDQGSGQTTGPVVAVQVKDTSIKNLETLLNGLQGKNTNEILPYRFFFQNDSKKSNESPTSNLLDVTSDLYATVLRPGLKTTEDVITVHYSPQAIFRVRPVSRCSAAISGHGEAILCTAFSPASSSILATGSGDNAARIWDCDTGTPKFTLNGHTSWVLVVSFSPEGSILATGSMDNTLRLWDPSTGSALGTSLKGHTKWITSLAWEPYHTQAPGKPRLASASKDSTIRIWDVPLRRIETVLSGHKGSVTCLRWGGLHRLYTGSQDKTIKIWNTRSWNCLQTLSAHSHWINHLALSTDAVLRTAHHNPATQSKQSHQSPTSAPDPLSNTTKRALAKSRFEASATLSGTPAERLLSASDDNTIYLWSDLSDSATTTPKPQSRLLGHQKQVTHASFSPSGHVVASASFDNSVKLWSAYDGTYLRTLRGHVGAVYMLCFSADSRLLVSASKDTTVKVWEVQTGRLVEDLTGHKDEVYAVDWSCDGKVVASGGRDKQVRLWKN